MGPVGPVGPVKNDKIKKTKKNNFYKKRWSHRSHRYQRERIDRAAAVPIDDPAKKARTKQRPGLVFVFVPFTVRSAR